MRLLYCWCIVLLVVVVSAQRKQPSQDAPNADAPTQRSAVASRGRARFTQTSEFSDFVQSTDDPGVRKSNPPSRRRLDYERHLQTRQGLTETTQKSGTASYEVSEVVDDIPIQEDSRKQRPKVITEQVFEAANSVKQDPTIQQTSTSVLSEIITQNVESSTATTSKDIALETSDTTPVAKSGSTESTLVTKPDIQRIRKPQETAKEEISPREESRRKLPRAQLRTRVNTRVDEPAQTTAASRVQARTRASRRYQEVKTEVATPAPEPIRSRGIRRRPSEPIQLETSRRGQTLSVENEHDHPSRSRTGRRSDIPVQRNNRRSDPSEDSVELRDVERSRRVGIHTASSRRRETTVVADKPQIDEPKLTSRNTNRRTVTRGRARSTPVEVTSENVPATIRSSRRSTRGRSPPLIDESKLEVLPLFESENKTEKSTAVDSIPDNFSSKTTPDATTPLNPSTTSPASSTTSQSTTVQQATPSETTKTHASETTSSTTPILPNGKSNRRFPSRTREVKNNKIDEPRNSRTSRRFNTPSSTQPPSSEAETTTRPSRARKTFRESPTRATSRSKIVEESTTANTESTTRKRFERIKPKRVVPTQSENRLQNLAPRRAGLSRRKDTGTPVISTTQATTTHRSRSVSRFNEKEELNIEEVAESTVTKSIEKLDAVPTPRFSRNTKRGTVKNRERKHSSEEGVDETDNYPAQFKALLQAKLKQKETANELDAAIKPKASTKSRLLPNEPRTVSTTPSSRLTTLPAYTATTKEVLSSVSSKVTRQRYHARYKSASNDKNKSTKNSTTATAIPSRALPSRVVKSRTPVAKTTAYSGKKNVRSTAAPEAETTTVFHKKSFPTRGAVIEQAVSTSEIPQVASLKPKGHRFSARYRSDILRATGFKSTTAPAYLPTVPTVTPGISAFGIPTENDFLEYHWSFNRL